MLFLHANDFFEKVERIRMITREEELIYAEMMAAGDPAGRERLIEGYLPYVAAHIRHSNTKPSLELIMRCYAALEKAVDRFDFLQNSERFTHHLNWALRQAVVSYLAER